jgi:hypothetical protein
MLRVMAGEEALMVPGRSWRLIGRSTARLLADAVAAMRNAAAAAIRAGDQLLINAVIS